EPRAQRLYRVAHAHAHTAHLETGQPRGQHAEALVEPVAAVPADQRRRTGTELDAPVVALPVAARRDRDREAARFGEQKPQPAAVVEGDVAFGVLDTQRVLEVEPPRWTLALAEH